MTIINTEQTNLPRIVTLAELQAKLVPLCRGDVWAMGSIVDLWKKGAPVPQPVNEPERRILIPEQFRLWFDDFSKRLGLNTPATTQYSNMQNQLTATSGGRISTRRRG